MCLKVKRSVILKPLSLIMSFILIFTIVCGAVLSAPVLVMAWSVGGLQSTIASLIISLMLQAGVAPVNQTWLNQINSSYGIESSIGTIGDCIENGLLTESGGQLIDSGLSEAIANQNAYSLIDDIFTTTAVDEGVLTATAATNLANTAINVGTLGTIGAFAGAAAIGVGLGVLINHIRVKITDYVKNSTPLTTPDTVMNNISQYGGNLSSWLGTNNRLRYIYHGDNAFVGKYLLGDGNIQVIVVSLDSINSQTIYTQSYSNNNGLSSISSETLQKYDSNNPSNTRNNVIKEGYIYSNDFVNFTDLGDESTYINNIANIRSNGYQRPSGMSPDLIGDNGNLTYDPDTNTVPDINRQVPDGYDMNPIDMTDYQDYVDQANDNTSNDDVGEDTQGQDLTDFIQPYLLPDQTQEDPTIPDDPVGPEQPDIPVKPTPAPEDIQDVLDLTADSDITDIFPFCIPFDIVDMVSAFTANRSAPSITCPVDMDGNTITVDLSDYEGIAALLRLLELILFIIGLAVATRKLIGAGG